MPFDTWDLKIVPQKSYFSRAWDTSLKDELFLVRSITCKVMSFTPVFVKATVTTILYGMCTHVCVPAVFTDDSFSNRLSSKFKTWAMSRLSRFRFLRFSDDGITFGESSPASGSESKQYNLIKYSSKTPYPFIIIIKHKSIWSNIDSRRLTQLFCYRQ